jgi:hypothetical protein
MGWNGDILSHRFGCNSLQRADPIKRNHRFMRLTQFEGAIRMTGRAA